MAEGHTYFRAKGVGAHVVNAGEADVVLMESSEG